MATTKCRLDRLERVDPDLRTSVRVAGMENGAGRPCRTVRSVSNGGRIRITGQLTHG